MTVLNSRIDILLKKKKAVNWKRDSKKLPTIS